MLDKYAIIEILISNPDQNRDLDNRVGIFKIFMPDVNREVTIYSTPSCHFCHMAKEFFKANNISYTEHDVAGDAEQRKIMIEKSGQMGVPVIQIGSDLIVGFNKPKIVELLGL